jgi:hypothetical protein
MAGSLGGAEAIDPEVPTINAKKLRQWPPLMLRNMDGGPLAGADGEPRAPTINIKNVNGGPPGRC